ncbi:hypothetical protein ACHQM5_005972 [Ranunculus cassubicifolius]
MAFFKSFLLFFTLFISLQLLMVQSVEFEVGEKEGWVVPSSKNNQVYNQWASKHRFQVGDNIHFKYSKDSVLAVTEQEYEKCRSAHPVFFSNNSHIHLSLPFGVKLKYLCFGGYGERERERERELISWKNNFFLIAQPTFNGGLSLRLVRSRGLDRTVIIC